MLDSPVLARGIDTLENDQDAMLALGPETVLKVRQPGKPEPNVFSGGLLGVPVRCCWIDPGKLDPRPGTNAQCIAEAAS